MFFVFNIVVKVTVTIYIFCSIKARKIFHQVIFCNTFFKNPFLIEMPYRQNFILYFVQNMPTAPNENGYSESGRRARCRSVDSAQTSKLSAIITALGLALSSCGGSNTDTTSSTGGTGGTTGTASTTETVPTTSTTDTTSTTSSTETNPVKASRMSADVMHPSIHIFTNFQTPAQVEADVQAMLVALFGDTQAPTCYEGPDGKKAQVAVQTEFIPPECAQKKQEECFNTIDGRLDVFKKYGIAVHLLLPVHQQINTPNWLGVDWNSAKWPKGNWAVPYQPTLTDVGGPYDKLSEGFQAPIIQHLIETGRAPSVVYVLNEFGYDQNVVNDTAADWNNDPNWKVVRQEALAATSLRILHNAKDAVVSTGDDTPVGIKFARIQDPDTGWSPPQVGDPDQLAIVLNDMNQQGNVLAYDAYILGDGSYNPANYARFQPFLPFFADGRFEFGEFGRECTGNEGQFVTGSRTTADDVVGAVNSWSPNGFNVFAWKTNICYAMVNSQNSTLYPGAEDTLKGIKDAASNFIGVPLDPSNACK